MKLHTHIVRLLLWLLLWTFPAFARAQYRSQVLNPLAATLEVHHYVGWNQPPVVELEGDDQVVVEFDVLDHENRSMGYRLLHCNADWTLSDRMLMDYMEGFEENELDEGEMSVATTVDYTHYALALPNEQVRLKISGNYVVEVFDRNDPSAVWLRACFCVQESLGEIQLQANTTTDRGYNQRYQQVEFDVYPRVEVSRPDDDLKVVVRQNRRLDNQVSGVKPLAAGAGVIHYRHRPELVFEAGNEYRRLEFNTYQLAGIGVDRIRFERPYYVVLPLDPQPRVNGYTYDEDINGRFFVNLRQDTNYPSSVSADYFQVRFRLPVFQAVKGKEVYLLGDFNQNRLDDRVRMDYLPAEACYEKTLLLKQGQYNYMYVCLPEGRSRGAADLNVFEGNYWETGNEYEVFVYYRPLWGEYDRLIAYRRLEYRP